MTIISFCSPGNSVIFEIPNPITITDDPNIISTLRTMVITGFEKIEREMIGNLKFPETDVLKNSRQIKARKSELQNVITKSSLENSTIKIYFEDENSRKVVETTVWAMTDKRVILKQSIGIPISRIHSVKL